MMALPRRSVSSPVRLPVRRFAVRGPRLDVELLVRDLPSGATAADVHAALTPLFDVKSVKVPTGRAPGDSRGTAYVTIDASDGRNVEHKLQSPIQLKGREMRVLLATNLSKPKVKAPPRPTPAAAAAASASAASPRTLNEQVASCESAAAVLALYDARGKDFNHVNLSTALHRVGLLAETFENESKPLLHRLLARAADGIRSDHRWDSRLLASACWGAAKLRFSGPAIFDAAAPAVLRKLAACNAQTLANVVWSFATAGARHAPLFDAVALEAAAKMATFKAQELANTAWAFARAGVEAPALFKAVASEAPKKMKTFNAQALANTAWAYARAGMEAPALFEVIAAESSKKIGTFTAQNLSNTAWAFATAGVEAPALFARIAEELPEKIGTFTPQALANTAWAFSTAGAAEANRPLFEAIAAEALKKIRTFTPQALANTAWAYATAGVLAPSLFETVAAEAREKIAQFNSQELANTAWAFAKARVAAPALFDAVAAEAPKKIAAFTSQNLSNTAWAYSTAGVSAPALFEAVAAESSKKMATFNSQALANTAWAYATAAVEAPALFEAIAAESLEKIATFEAQALANTAWALATAGVEAPQLFEAMASSIQGKFAEFNHDGLSQLHQVYVHLWREAPQHALPKILSRHEAELRAAYIRQEPSPPPAQRDVSAALDRIGWAHAPHVTAEGLRVNCAQPATSVAVEFAGPAQYLAGGAAHVLDGRSRFKERMLGRLGWKVVRVPYFEWDALRSSAEQGSLKLESPLRVGAGAPRDPLWSPMGLLDLVVAVACALPVLARAYALGTLHLWCAPSLVTPRLALCLFGISLNYVAHAGIWKYPEAFAKLCAKKPLSHLGRHPVAVFAAGELLFKVWQWGCVLALLGGSPAPLWRAAADAPNWTKVYGLALAGAGQVLNGAMYAAIGNDGVYYGFKLGRAVPWCHAFPFNVGLRHPQYVGVVLTLLGLLSVFQSQELAEAGMAMLIVGWSLMYVYMSLMEELGDNDKKKP